MIDPVDDVPKIALVVLLAFLALTGAWAAIDHRSRSGAIGRWARSGRIRRWLWILVALAVFAAMAEDVVFQEREESVLTLDAAVYAFANHIQPAIRRAASMISRLTGEGVAVTVALAILGLATRRHTARAAVIVGGTLGAWALSGMLKLACGVHRPRWTPAVLHASNGFPSGHALVTLVACLLIARVLGHDRGPRTRIALEAGAWSIALLTGVARIIAKAHWTSDVVAGFAVGAAWATVVTMLADSWGVTASDS